MVKSDLDVINDLEDLIVQAKKNFYQGGPLHSPVIVLNISTMEKMYRAIVELKNNNSMLVNEIVSLRELIKFGEDCDD